MTFFGARLEDDIFDRSKKLAATADSVLVIGSSLSVCPFVSPVSSLVHSFDDTMHSLVVVMLNSHLPLSDLFAQCVSNLSHKFIFFYSSLTRCVLYSFLCCNRVGKPMAIINQGATRCDAWAQIKVDAASDDILPRVFSSPKHS
jgi:NAD-dependent SIR2 family protein deacetylase